MSHGIITNSSAEQAARTWCAALSGHFVWVRGRCSGCPKRTLRFSRSRMSCVNTIGAFVVCAELFGPLAQAQSCDRARRQSAPATKGAATERIEKVQSGVWGGEHIMLEVTEEGGKLTFDCAHGTIEQPLVLAAAGRFDVRGTYVREQGGPVRSDHIPASRQACYTGRVEGKNMTLTVTLSDTKETVATFSLVQGELPELTRCA